MPCVAEAVQEFASLSALPDAARALFGQDAFSTLAWFGATLEAGLPAGAQACFQVVWSGEAVLAVLPMRRDGRLLSALTTPYTCLWQPLVAPGADAMAVGRALAGHWRRAGVVRLDCMPASPVLDGLFRGLRAGGLRVLAFNHFGNWHLDVAGLAWKDYVDSRPGPLRSAVTRPVGRLMRKPGAVYTLVSGMDGLEPAIEAYEYVYARSWKEPEPQPDFNATLMRASAAAGTLRLGVLRLDGTPIAAQFWLLNGKSAAVLKLAYDEEARKLSPGNVLTALVIRHLLEEDRIEEIDFGRGDDEYKPLWTGDRRQRVGALIANPLSIAGCFEIARYRLSQIKKRLP